MASNEPKVVEQPSPPFQSTLSRVLLLLVTPFVLLALCLWWLLGQLFTLSGRVVAALTVVTGFALYLSIPDIPLRLLDWPLVLTAVAAICVLAHKRAAPQLAVWLAVAVYSILRASLLDESGTTAHLVNALCAACVLFPGWMIVCNLSLWLPADGQTLEEVEEKIYNKYLVTEFTLQKVAGLGTVHVPYCGDSPQLPPRNLVLVHGYMAGNAFWAAVRLSCVRAYVCVCVGGVE